jgi:hypothetical protein
MNRLIARFLVLGSLIFAVMLLSGGTLAAQQIQGPALQLPTYQFFTVQTSVSVPDGGQAFLGGVSRSGMQSTSRGIPGGFLPFRNRAFSRSIGASSVSVSASIHDLQALDEAVLELARRRRQGAPGLQTPEAPVFAGNVQSLEALAAERLAAAQAEQAEAYALFERGQKAEQQGKAGAARIYYDMAVRQATGALKELAAEKLAGLER